MSTVQDTGNRPRKVGKDWYMLKTNGVAFFGHSPFVVSRKYADFVRAKFKDVTDNRLLRIANKVIELERQLDGVLPDSRTL